jgi:hypothetical protein
VQPFDLPAGELLLRPWREDDLDGLDAATQDTEVRRWNDPGSTSRDDVRAMLARRRDWSAGDHAYLAVVAGLDGDLLGSVSLHSIDREQAVKAGFTLEGRLRRPHRYADGKKHDELLWSRPPTTRRPTRSPAAEAGQLYPRPMYGQSPHPGTDPGTAAAYSGTARPAGVGWRRASVMSGRIGSRPVPARTTSRAKACQRSDRRTIE